MGHHARPGSVLRPLSSRRLVRALPQLFPWWRRLMDADRPPLSCARGSRRRPAPKNGSCATKPRGIPPATSCMTWISTASGGVGRQNRGRSWGLSLERSAMPQPACAGTTPMTWERSRGRSPERREDEGTRRARWSISVRREDGTYIDVEGTPGRVVTTRRAGPSPPSAFFKDVTERNPRAEADSAKRDRRNCARRRRWRLWAPCRRHRPRFNNILGAILGYGRAGRAGCAARQQAAPAAQRRSREPAARQGLGDQSSPFARRGKREKRALELWPVVARCAICSPRRPRKTSPYARIHDPRAAVLADCDASCTSC